MLGDQGGKVVRPVWCGARAREAEMACRVGLQFGGEREQEEEGELTCGVGVSERERERDARAWKLTDGVRMSAARGERERLTMGRAAEKGRGRKGKLSERVSFICFSIFL